MHKIIVALAGFAFAAGLTSAAHAMPASAPEAQELMKEYFGNTRICREDKWFECHMWLNADGSYVLFNFQVDEVVGDPRHGFSVVRGTWTIEGTKGDYKLCRKPEDSDRALCLPEPERPDITGADRQHLGDTFWKYHDTGTLKGETEHYYMVSGHR